MADGWWNLDGAISSCVGAYQAVGAASLAASYSNLLNPGTNDLTTTAAPTWNATDGWIFSGSTFLDTAIVPAAANWSMIVRFSNGSAGNYTAVGMHAETHNNRFYLRPQYNSASHIYGYGSNGNIVSGALTSGVMALAGVKSYINGSPEAADGTGTWNAGTNLSIYVGGVRTNGGLAYGYVGYIQAVAIYNAQISAEQVASLTTAINALPAAGTDDLTAAEFTLAPVNFDAPTLEYTWNTPSCRTYTIESESRGLKIGCHSESTYEITRLTYNGLTGKDLTLAQPTFDAPTLGAGSWLYGLNPSLKTVALKKVSCFGDSIMAGSYNEPVASGVWTPEAANNILAQNETETTISGNTLFTAATAVVSSGVSLSGTEFTLTASAGDTNPRFVSSNDELYVIDADKFYLNTCYLNNENCVGKHLAGRCAPATSDNQALTDLNYGGDSVSTAGYVKKSFIASGSFILNTIATSNKVRTGGEIAGSETSGTGLIKDVAFYEVSKGMAIHNQGVSGEDSADGLARIATVTAWAPHIVFVAFGTNDIREETIDLAGFLANLGAIGDAIVTANGYPVLCAMPPLGTDQTNYTLVPTWNDSIKTLALSNSWGFWNRWADLDNGNLDYIADGRHPTRAGYLKLASSLASLLSGTA